MVARSRLGRGRALAEVTARHWHFSKWMTLSEVMRWSMGDFFLIISGALLGPAIVGALRATMRLTPRGDGLDMHLVSARFGWVPLFGPLKPVIKAEERVDGNGNHRFDVDIGLPLIGRLVAYRGYLKV